MKNIYIFVLMIPFIFTGCSSNSANTIYYAGKSLDIGVVGDTPNVKNQNINFKEITLKQIEDQAVLSGLDAVFIMKEHLQEASVQKYAEVYKTAGIPFFFFESKKSFVPFINEDLEYDDVPDMSSDMYATGYFSLSEDTPIIGYGLYNDVENEKNIADVYSRVFISHINREVK
ncbi:hypothetical protein D3C75_818850 [compost metagenome]